MSRRRSSLRMRTKVTLFFALLALAATIGLSVLTYTFARSSLLDQRESDARQQAVRNALSIQSQLRADPANIGEEFGDIRTERGGFAVVRMGPGQRYPTDLRYDDRAFPDELRQLVDTGQPGRQGFAIDGSPFVGVGIPLTGTGGAYYEAFPLSDTQRTLRTLTLALAGGSTAIVLLATGAGWWTSRRLLRPIGRLADAAGGIAAGDLTTRVSREPDPDLDRLVHAFNGMADSVQARIEREARFASDVSHELRSPITALTAAVEVLDRRRDDLPERTAQAMSVVVDQVRRFDSMVLDLLELARLDAGTADVHTDARDLRLLVPKVLDRLGYADVPVVVGDDVETVAQVDQLRFERILANLLDNATHHAHGPRSVTLTTGDDGFVDIAVADDGPGVEADERERIFERFARGGVSRRRVGTGLGLALVAEHARAQGGRAWVDDAPGGGARFVFSLPVAP